ncbi:MAG: Ig-like domain-containing protein [Flavobacteriaceae bacterium]|nr:Ig-like domain-containing protein [Flavobacteriaceae bacterium]
MNKKFIVFISLIISFFGVEFLHAQCPTAEGSIMYAVTESRELVKITVDGNTATAQRLCTTSRVYGDVAISPTGEIYGTWFNSGWDNRMQVYKINPNNCSETLVYEWYSNVTNGSRSNSLSFLPDGTMLVGFGETTDRDHSQVHRLTPNGSGGYTRTLWNNFVTGWPAGDYVYLNGKVYVSWRLNSYTFQLFSVTVDENYNYVDHTLVNTGQNFGLAIICGDRIVGGIDNSLFTINPETGATTPITWNSGAIGNIWGLTGIAEADPSVCITDGSNYNEPIVTVINNTCDGQVGQFIVTTTPVPGFVLEYSTNNGQTWSTSLPAYDNQNPITVMARLSSPRYPGCYSPSSDPVTSKPVRCYPDLTILKTSLPIGEVSPNDEITYTIEVTNNGNIEAQNVTLTDVLPSGVSYINGTAQKTYPMDQVTPGPTLNGTYTKYLDDFSFDGENPKIQKFSITREVPSDAKITSISYSTGGYSSDYRSGISMSAYLPNGTNVFNIDRNGDSDNDEFGWYRYYWRQVSRSNVSVAGAPSAIGTYELRWYDNFNGILDIFGPENTARNSTFTINYTYGGPSGIKRILVTNAAAAPSNMVTAADNVDLRPGEKLTVTLKVKVNANASGTLTNTATADADNAEPATDDVTNTVINPNSVLANNDINQTPVNVPVNGDVLHNDYDPQGDSFTVTEFNGTPIGTTPVMVTVSGTDDNGNIVPNAGNITINPDGSYIYTPAPDFTGIIKVNYEITDAYGANDTATLTIVVIGPNENDNYPPIAQNDYDVMTPGTPITIPVLSNDSDPDGSLNETTVNLIPESVPNATGTDSNGDGNIDTVIVPGQGTWTVNPSTGDVTFTPVPGFTDNPTPIDYNVKDNNGNESNPATITIITENLLINEMSATDDANSGFAGDTLTGNVLNNDNDPDGSTGTPSVSQAWFYDQNGTKQPLPISTPTTVYAWNGNTWAEAGTITLNTNGTYTYVSNEDFVGTVIIPYAACDNNTPNNACDNATLYLTTVEEPCVTIAIKVFLEGSFIGDGTMYSKLNVNHLLPGMNPRLSSNPTIQRLGISTPAGQPYAVVPWSYNNVAGNQFGDESTNPGSTPYPTTVVDWVLVSIRENGISPTNKVWECVGFVHTDGSVTFAQECGCLQGLPGSNYYIIVQHRNHMPIMTPSAIQLTNGMLSWDFTTSDSYKVRRKGQKQIQPGVWVMYGGNGEQQLVLADRSNISSSDQNIWFNQQNIFKYINGDYNMDGVVSSQDQILWFNNQNVNSDIPW